MSRLAAILVAFVLLAAAPAALFGQEIPEISADPAHNTPLRVTDIAITPAVWCGTESVTRGPPGA